MCNPTKKLMLAKPDQWTFWDEKIENFLETCLGFEESEMAEEFQRCDNGLESDLGWMIIMGNDYGKKI